MPCIPSLLCKTFQWLFGIGKAYIPSYPCLDDFLMTKSEQVTRDLPRLELKLYSWSRLWSQPIWNYMLVKLDHFPKDGGWIKINEYLKPPPIPYHPCMIDLPTFSWILMVNLGRYTSPMDAMGIAKYTLRFSWLPKAWGQHRRLRNDVSNRAKGSWNMTPTQTSCTSSYYVQENPPKKLHKMTNIWTFASSLIPSPPTNKDLGLISWPLQCQHGFFWSAPGLFSGTRVKIQGDDDSGASAKSTYATSAMDVFFLKNENGKHEDWPNKKQQVPKTQHPFW